MSFRLCVLLFFCVCVFLCAHDKKCGEVAHKQKTKTRTPQLDSTANDKKERMDSFYAVVSSADEGDLVSFLGQRCFKTLDAAWDELVCLLQTDFMLLNSIEDAGRYACPCQPTVLCSCVEGTLEKCICAEFCAHAEPFLEASRRLLDQDTGAFKTCVELNRSNVRRIMRDFCQRPPATIYKIHLNN